MHLSAVLVALTAVAGQQHCEYHDDNIQLQQFYRIIIITLKLHPHFLHLFVIIVLPLVDVNFVVFDEFKHTFGKQFRPAIVQQYTIEISYHLRPITN
ncbi:hypothetical protein CGMCC3_g11960 [Colletotrichum fructicola]|uniref:Secreted protein n=1 Tax=Colletotrichum fructicola (strain Nara gc5) TaxID=1213859 RepID=A0A7J6IL90_COLFN|nr:uncharacterized protein CGMCC3_g11960 [Colletotrichum fructicola]KAE9571955.1 hypothetical protein CGMCC3_g11960 [Colletotrichum fructicola]KAF4477540.1 hypothetical protein CGGC5_v013166 [Colletotrichum fructicola Nara gc5]KAI8281658.1 hypothetical protein K4K60_003993 [Colletotrichum sp. SAR11_57]